MLFNSSKDQLQNNELKLSSSQSSRQTWNLCAQVKTKPMICVELTETQAGKQSNDPA